MYKRYFVQHRSTNQRALNLLSADWLQLIRLHKLSKYIIKCSPLPILTFDNLEETHFILLKKLKQTCLDVVKEARPDLSQNPDLPELDFSSP